MADGAKCYDRGMTAYGYTLFDTAIGPCGVAWSDRGLVGVKLPEASETETRVRMLQRFPAAAEIAPSHEVQLAIDLVRDIHRSGVTLVIVEHIIEVIMALSSRVMVFHQGKEIARGSPREVTSNPAVIAAYLGTRAAKAAAGHTPIELMGGPVS